MMKKMNKKLASAIVLGLMLAVPVGVSAAVSGPDENGVITVTGSHGASIGSDESRNDVVFEAKASWNGNDGTIYANNITAEKRAGNGSDFNNLFYVGSGKELTINAAGNIVVEKGSTGIEAFHTMSGKLDVDAENIYVYDSVTAVCAQTGSGAGDGVIDIDATNDIYLKTTGYKAVTSATYNGNTGATSVDIAAGNDLTIVTEGGSHAVAVTTTYEDGSHDTNGNSMNLSAGNTLKIQGIDTNDKTSEAILVENSGSTNARQKLNISAKDIIIDGNIDVLEKGDVTIGGNDGFNSAVITGNIQANGSSNVSISLGNGSLEGAIVSDDTSDVSLDMEDAVWNVTGNSKVRKITGEGTIALNVDDLDDMDSVTIGNTDDADLTVAAQQNADDVADANAALDAMADAVEGLDDGTVIKVKEGILKGETSGTLVNGDGNDNNSVTNIHQDGTTSTMGNMRDLASVALVAWRQEDSTLSQRLGELRSSEGDQGIWARMSRGEFEYDGAFKNQYNYFQMGYDWAAGDWHYGAAISHNDGQTTYAQGNGENDSTSLTLYGTWLGDKGQYTDIVVKQGKLNNEFTNYAEAGVTKADYDMWGTSISAEYGQKLEMENDWYITPQAQLTYMRIGGEDYTATVDSQPMQVSQDGMDSFVGRIGFEAGKNISEKGSVYAKASLLHEFAGEADTYLQLNDVSNIYSQDLGDTWYECGFGVNYKTSDSSYVYADVVKTFGGDVETPWQWNAGMRWSF